MDKTQETQRKIVTVDNQGTTLEQYIALIGQDCIGLCDDGFMLAIITDKNDVFEILLKLRADNEMNGATTKFSIGVAFPPNLEDASDEERDNALKQLLNTVIKTIDNVSEPNTAIIELTPYLVTTYGINQARIIE